MVAKPVFENDYYFSWCILQILVTKGMEKLEIVPLEVFHDKTLTFRSFVQSLEFLHFAVRQCEVRNLCFKKNRPSIQKTSKTFLLRLLELIIALENTSKLALSLSGLVDFGITTIFCCVRNRRRTCAVVFPWALATSITTGLSIRGIGINGLRARLIKFYSINFPKIS